MEMKPCKCGGKACVYSDGWRVWYSVQCDVCYFHTTEYRSEKEAIEAWNLHVGEGEKE